MTPRLLLLVLTAQLADLCLFGLAASRVGIGGESGPLGPVYVAGGFGAVALAKLAATGAMLAILARLRSQRLALLAAGMGVFGAATALGAIA